MIRLILFRMRMFIIFGREEGGWGEETMPLGRRMLEQERMPSTLKALQAVFNLYYKSIPCSIQYLLHAIKRQNIGSVQLGGCTQWRCSATKMQWNKMQWNKMQWNKMQCNQVNIKCINNQPFTHSGLKQYKRIQSNIVEEHLLLDIAKFVNIKQSVWWR